MQKRGKEGKGSKEPAKRSYHHGDLPRSLIAAAVAHIEAHGVEQLSLRDLAREMGVSHGAPYRHFADKRALLAGIAETGFEALFEALRVASAGPDPSMIKRLEDMAWAYVRFAVENPVYVTLMFGPEFADKSERETLAAASEAVLAFVQGLIEQGQKEKALVKGDALVQTAAAWSMVHGLALLMSSRCMHNQGFEAYTAEVLTRRTVAALFSGLARI